MADLRSAMKHAVADVERPLDIGALATIAARRTRRRRISGALVVIAALVLALPLLRSTTTEKHVVGRHHERNGARITPAPTPPPGSSHGHSSSGSLGAPAGASSGAGSTIAGPGSTAGPTSGKARVGGHIVYSDNTGVEVVDPATKHVRLVYGTDSISDAFTRDGSMIAYTRYNMATMEVDTVRPDGTDHRAIVTNMVGDPYSLTWSPDGTRILFGVDTTDYSGSSFKLYIVNRDGSGLRVFNEIPASDQPAEPRWSPDGTKIAYTSEPSTASSAANTAKPYVKIYDLKTGTRSTVVSGSAPTWSPDGTSLAYVDANAGIEMIDLATHHRTVIVAGKGTSGGADNAPSFSPDGQFVAFTQDPPSSPTGGQLPAIYYVRVDGSGGTMVGPNGQNCSWSL